MSTRQQQASPHCFAWLARLPCASVAEALSTCREVLQQLDVEGDAARRAQLIHICGRVCEQPAMDMQAEVAPQLLTILQDDCESRACREAALSVLAKHASRMRSLQGLLPASLACLREESFQLRSKALQLLSALDSATAEAVLPVLRSFASDSHAVVRREALLGLLARHATEQAELGPADYTVALTACDDDHEGVRLAALDVMATCAQARRDDIIGQRFGQPLRLVEDAFVRICNLVTDGSVRVRERAQQLLGGLSAASGAIQMQALNKKATTKVKRLKPDPGADSGDTDAEPQNSTFAADTDLMDSSAGAFVHGLEDENEAVRTSTVTTLLRLSHGNPELAAAALDYLIDMLNDELEAVRVHAAAGLAGMEVTEVTVPESQLRLLLCGLEDTSAEMRRSVATFVARLNCRSAAALESTVAALLRSLAEASPAEFQCSAGALARLGQRHAPLVECLVDTLFGEQAQPNLDDPQHVGRLILVANAAPQHPGLLPLLPEPCLAQLCLLERRHAGLVPRLQLRHCGLGVTQVLPPQQDASVEKAAPSPCVNGIGEVLSLLESMPPAMRARPAGWRHLARVDAHLARIGGAGNGGASATAMFARLHVQVAGQLALAQLAALPGAHEAHSAACWGGAGQSREGVLDGIHKLPPMPTTPQAALLQADGALQLARMARVCFASRGELHTAPSLLLAAVGHALSLMLRQPGSGGSVAEEAAAMAGVVREWRELRGGEPVRGADEEMMRRLGAAALRGAAGEAVDWAAEVAACWLALPPMPPSLALRSARVAGSQAPQAASSRFVVRHSPGMPLRFDVKVALEGGSSWCGGLYVRVAAPLCDPVLLPLRPSSAAQRRAAGEARATPAAEELTVAVELDAMPPLERAELAVALVTCEGGRRPLLLSPECRAAVIAHP